MYSEVPSEQNPIKHFREKGAWEYPGTAQFFRVPPIISGTGKATDFKFRQYIQRVHPNKSPLKFWRKGSVGVSRDCPIFFGYPLLSHERVKLRNSDFARTFIGSVGTKTH